MADQGAQVPLEPQLDTAEIPKGTTGQEQTPVPEQGSDAEIEGDNEKSEIGTRTNVSVAISPVPYPESAEKRKVGRPRSRNPDGSFKFPKRPPTVRRSPPPDGEKRSVGRPRKRNPDGSLAHPDRTRKIIEGSTAPDGEPRPVKVPRADWLGDAFTRKEIFRALVEYDYAWLPSVQSLKLKHPGRFDKLGESTVRSWFEPGTNQLRPQVIKKLQKVTKTSLLENPDVPVEMIPPSQEGAK